jgi:hypothetical protein
MAPDTPTARPSPTPTLAPTATSPPTATYEPAPELNSAVAETALRAEGYKRYPIGEDSFFWDNGSGIVFYTYPDGLGISILNDPNNLAGREELIDKAIDTVAPLFAPGGISDLRDEAHAYADRVVSVTGEATVLDNGEEPWLGKLMEFNGYDTSIQNGPDALRVYVRLLFREYKCDMRKYSACYLTDAFDEFTGGLTLTFSTSCSIPVSSTLEVELRAAQHLDRAPRPASHSARAILPAGRPSRGR